MANQNFKYFVEGYDPETTSGLVELRKLFTSTDKVTYYFLKGNHKGTKGAFVVTDLKNREYGEKRKSYLTNVLNKDVYFWAPQCDPKEFDLDSWFISREPIPHIDVKLHGGRSVKINPAAGEPQQMLFGEPIVEEEIAFASMYSKATEYGRLAYKLIYREEELKDQGGFMNNDPELVQLIEMAFENSYSLPKDALNWLAMVSFHDVSELYQAAMGANQSFLAWLQGGSG